MSFSVFIPTEEMIQDVGPIIRRLESEGAISISINWNAGVDENDGSIWKTITVTGRTAAKDK